MDADMLHHREQAVLRGRVPTLTVFVEDAKAERRGNDRVRDCENLVKRNELLHLDQPVREDESLQLQAERIWKLADELLVSCTHLPPVVVRIVVDSALLEV